MNNIKLAPYEAIEVREFIYSTSKNRVCIMKDDILCFFLGSFHYNCFLKERKFEIKINMMNFNKI
ncbi:MAG: hypothetical protein GX308_00345 [Epulopiscium sp.]|nr:hypothetical protein [Candidatus Epulonipiscium sp.]